MGELDQFVELIIVIDIVATHESIIEILVDVLKEFYKKFLSSLEISIHDETENNSSGFPVSILQK